MDLVDLLWTLAALISPVLFLISLKQVSEEPSNERSYTGYCKQCDYDLSGLPRDETGCGKCAECGTTFDIHTLKVHTVRRLTWNRAWVGLFALVACALSHFVIDLVWFIGTLAEGYHFNLAARVLRKSLVQGIDEERLWVIGASLMFVLGCGLRTAKLEGPQLTRLMTRGLLLWGVILSAWALVAFLTYRAWWWTEMPNSPSDWMANLLLTLRVSAVVAGVGVRLSFGWIVRRRQLPSTSETNIRLDAGA